MSNISYVALSQATALTRSMDTTAHNLANATTSGYKAIHPVLESIPDGSLDPREFTYIPCPVACFTF